jgi:hypothetical protein
MGSRVRGSSVRGWSGVQRKVSAMGVECEGKSVRERSEGRGVGEHIIAEHIAVRCMVKDK